MKKKKILIPEPKSKFVLVRCPECENEQIIFDHAASVVRCLVCNSILALPKGGKTEIKAKIIKYLE
ncbi:MAG: 30S ribosomal protein S27e [Thermoprotei archaeon]|nr:MAG: 30S ribosomal protein S27e [Thermoprotei archaeon]